MAKDSYGTLITHTSAFVASVTGVDWSGIERAALSSLHLGTPATSNGVAVETMFMSDIVKMGKLQLTMFWEPDNPPPLYNDGETITLTAPVPRGKSKGATMTGPAGFTACGMAMPGPGQTMTSSAELSWLGEVQFSPSS